MSSLQPGRIQLPSTPIGYTGTDEYAHIHGVVGLTQRAYAANSGYQTGTYSPLEQEHLVDIFYRTRDWPLDASVRDAKHLKETYSLSNICHQEARAYGHLERLFEREDASRLMMVNALSIHGRDTAQSIAQLTIGGTPVIDSTAALKQITASYIMFRNPLLRIYMTGLYDEVKQQLFHNLEPQYG
jgi:hypothetical protein